MTDPRDHYRCRLVDVIDFCLPDLAVCADVEVDLGFGVRLAVRVALPGVQVRTRADALAVSMAVSHWCEARGDRLTVRTAHDTHDTRDTFGRVLGTLVDYATGETLEGTLLEAGLVVREDGRRHAWGSV